MIAVALAAFFDHQMLPPSLATPLRSIRWMALSLSLYHSRRPPPRSRTSQWPAFFWSLRTVVTSQNCWKPCVKKSMHRKRGGHFELVFFDLVHITEFLVVLGLLDRIRGGVYRLVFLTPSVATWSRVRHSEEQGQMPLPSKTEHLVFLSWIHMPSQRSQPQTKSPSSEVIDPRRYGHWRGLMKMLRGSGFSVPARRS